jgi:transposase-like protein
MDQNTQRWTATRKAELVAVIMKKEKTLTDACRENDLKRSEVNKWIEQFLDGGKRNLKVNSKDQMVEHRKQIQSLQRKIGELVLENDVLKRASSLFGSDEETEY